MVSASPLKLNPARTYATLHLTQPFSLRFRRVSKIVELPGYSRGCHVITRPLLQQLPELSEFEVGLANIFIQHTSASLTINENASPDVPLDLADALDRLAPEGTQVKYRHDDEGPDDMPAHVKVRKLPLRRRNNHSDKLVNMQCRVLIDPFENIWHEVGVAVVLKVPRFNPLLQSSLMGPGLTLPIAHGRLALGIWQGIYLNEHRNYGGPRKIVVTIQGQKRGDGRRYGDHR